GILEAEAVGDEPVARLAPDVIAVEFRREAVVIDGIVDTHEARLLLSAGEGRVGEVEEEEQREAIKDHNRIEQDAARRKCALPEAGLRARVLFRRDFLHFDRSRTVRAGPEKGKKSATFAVSADKAPEPKSSGLVDTCDEPVNPRELRPRRGLKPRFRQDIRLGDGGCPDLRGLHERPPRGKTVAVGTDACGSVPRGSRDQAAAAASAQPPLDETRARPEQDRQPDRDGALVLRHDLADRARDAAAWQGFVAAQARARFQHLLDRPRARTSA